MEHEHRFTERFHRDGKLYRTCGECRHTELEPVQPSKERKQAWHHAELAARGQFPRFP